MPMRATTVRFAEDLWLALEREAAAQGVSAAQFVREATIMRIAYTMGLRGDEPFERALRTLTGDDPRAGLPPVPIVDAEVRAAVQDPLRLAALRASGLLDSPPEERFDRFTRLAAEVLNAPVALVSLVEEDRQFLKSCLGLPEPWASRRETPLSHSFCQHAVARREPLLITDAREDPALRDNLAIPDLDVVAYAGVPLIDREGRALGSLCVIDSKPRQWSQHQVKLLEDLAAAVVSEIEARPEPAAAGA